MQFIDLAAQQRRIRKKIEAHMARVLDHGQYILGPEVAELEGRLAALVGAPHALGCASGTDALLLALLALKIGPGDAVFLPAFTFFAGAEVVMLLGATPVFVDIASDTYNLDPLKLERAAVAARTADPRLHPLPEHPAGPLKPRAVLAVDLFGLPADYGAIAALAQAEGLTVIEDAAQSLGARQQGRWAGALAPLAATSFYPAKPLGAYGDAGMVFASEPELDAIMRSLRMHGMGAHAYEHLRVGLNARLDTMQAAVLLAKLEIFEEELALRQEVAGRYHKLLAGAPGLRPPQVPQGSVSAWAQYSVLAADPAKRQELRERLAQAQVPTAVHYPKPLHLQEACASLGYRPGDFPVAEFTAERIFSLPMHPYLEAAEQERIAALLSQG
ncbi:MAG: DegT/DnrJ/EryC1/StrS family aminotransferase [Desulfarculus sp.]|nr:MAG: DegT/DnrJ/EryC1/StrS family aminotransferase [Desulfarculus sp.]